MKRLLTKSVIYIITLNLFLYGCSTAPMSDTEKQVKISRKSDPSSNCTKIGKVHAPGFSSISDQGHEDDLKRATTKVGRNTVTLDRIDDNRTYFGTAYKCPKHTDNKNQSIHSKMS